ERRRSFVGRDENAGVDPVRARFSATADKVAARAERELEPVREQLQQLVPLRGDERALDAGTGAGVLALALAPLVRTVVGLDLVPELLDAARRRAPENATFVEGDATALPFDDGYFDLSGTRRTLHHIRRPELVLAGRARGVHGRDRLVPPRQARLSCSARVQVRERAPELLALRGEGGERAREPPLPLGSEPKMCDPRIHRRCFPLDETGLLRAPDELRHARLGKLEPLGEIGHRGLLAAVGSALDHQQKQVALGRQPARARTALAVAEELPESGA